MNELTFENFVYCKFLFYLVLNVIITTRSSSILERVEQFLSYESSHESGLTRHEFISTFILGFLQKKHKERLVTFY
jgi:hypothetical protein